MQTCHEAIQIAKESPRPQFDVDVRKYGGRRGIAKRAVGVEGPDVDLLRDEVPVQRHQREASRRHFDARLRTSFRDITANGSCGHAIPLIEWLN
jgi:hypothetical protein